MTSYACLLIGNHVDGQHRPVCHQCVEMGRNLSLKPKGFDEKDANLRLYKCLVQECGKNLIYEKIRHYRENANLNITNEFEESVSF